MTRYTYDIKWLIEDEAYICKVREFPSLGTHGDTSEEALKEMNIVLKLIQQELKEK